MYLPFAIIFALIGFGILLSVELSVAYALGFVSF